MAITVVIGGQFGSEGKGKVCGFLAEQTKPSIMVRCGGPNSGHTVYKGDQACVFRQLPVGAVVSQCRLLIPAGGYLSIPILKEEIAKYKIDPKRVGIDRNTMVVTQNHIDQETRLGLSEKIGSTKSGTGAAVADRVLRGPNVKLAKDFPELQGYMTDVVEEVYQANQSGQGVIIEGSQGAGLSIFHTADYPYATGRDTNAAGFISEVGVSPRDVTDIVMVIRAFPIRVAGNSGPLANETDWEHISKLSGKEGKIKELTTVTGKVRRVGYFDSALVKRAIQINSPTAIFMNHLDYLDEKTFCDSSMIAESIIIYDFIKTVENEINKQIDYIGFGPKTKDLIKDKTFVVRKLKSG